MISMGVSKVEFDGRTLVDLTKDSVTPETLMVGATAHNSAGEPIVGQAVAGGLDGVGNEYLWEKRTKEISETTDEVTKTQDDYTIGQITVLNMYAYTSDTFPETGYGVVSNLPTTGTQGFGFHVENWERVNLSFSTAAVNSLKKYFWIPSVVDGSFTPYKTYIYEKDANTTATATTVMPNQYLSISGAGYWTAKRTTNVIPSEHITYVNSPDPNAYPIEDGYDYVSIGKIGDLLKSLI